MDVWYQVATSSRLGIVVLLFALVYVGAFFLNSLLLRAILRFVQSTKKEVSLGIDFRDHGTWIGLCEHFLVVSFVLLDQYTALALIFGAKELARKDDVIADPGYYLLGTLLNICLSLVSGAVLKFALYALVFG